MLPLHSAHLGITSLPGFPRFQTRVGNAPLICPSRPPRWLSGKATVSSTADPGSSHVFPVRLPPSSPPPPPPPPHLSHISDYPRRRNVTTPMVGLKKKKKKERKQNKNKQTNKQTNKKKPRPVTYVKNLTRNGKPGERWGTQKKKI